jgi:exo-beta-1,3-glucanase (GH17 family)
VKDTFSSVKSGVEVWVSETGWPTSGNTENEAVASVANAQQYWDMIACAAFSELNTFWYALQDFSASPSFGVVNADFNAPYDLSCPDTC